MKNIVKRQTSLTVRVHPVDIWLNSWVFSCVINPEWLRLSFSPQCREHLLCLPHFEHMGLYSFFKSFRIRGTWLIKGMSFFVSQVWCLFANTITDTMNGTAQNTVLFHIFLIKMLQSTKKEYNFNLPLWP